MRTSIAVSFVRAARRFVPVLFAALAALAVVLLALSVRPIQAASASAPLRLTATPLGLPAPVGAMTQAYVDDVAPAPQPASSSTPPLETVLNPDGSLRGGLSGSFNAEGFELTYGADGGPRFAPSGSSSPKADGYASFVYNLPNSNYTLPNSNLRAIAVSGSDVYVGGEFTDLGGIAEADYVAKWNGTSWSALGGGAQDIVFAIAVSGSDVYVGGRFRSVYSSGTTPVTGTGYLAKWNGSAWSALGGGVQSIVFAIAVSGSDVYVGGAFGSVYSSSMARIMGTGYIAKWNGSAWSALGGGVQNSVFAIAVNGSDVYVGGDFTSVYSSGTTEVTDTRNIAKWNGSAWSALGGGVQNSVFAIAVSGSDVYVGGAFGSVYSSGTTEVAGTGYLAKWNGNAWSPLGGGVQSFVYTLAVEGSDVYVGGDFTSVYSSGTTPVDGTSRIAKWNGSAWSALGGGVERDVYVIAVSGSGVYVGGRFTSVYGSGTTAVPGTSQIAKWNGNAWSTAVPSGNGANGVVYVVAVNGSDVYVGGDFTDLGGIAEADYVAKWDGRAWSALGGGAGSYVHALAVSGSDVYVGGTFTSVYSSGTTSVAGTGYLAKWNGNAWSPLGGGVQNSVFAIAVSGSDVYVGGTFTSVYSSGTTSVAGTGYLAKWNGNAWSPLGGGVDGSVFAIAVSGSDVYAGGGFGSVYNSGTTAVPGTSQIAKWNGSAWSALGGGAEYTVYTLAVSGSDVYIGGNFTSVYSSGFTTVDGTSRIAKWNGSAWSALGGGVDGSVFAIAVRGSDVYVGGRFTTVYSSGTTEVTGTGYIAKWNGTAWSALGSGVNDIVFALALGTAEPAPQAVRGQDIAPMTLASQAAVSALYLGGDFTAANDGTPASRFTYYTGPEITPVGNEPEEEVANGGGSLVTILGNGSHRPRVRIEGSGLACAEVYDVLGRRVATIYNGVVPGTAEVLLPSSLAAGSYLVRVSADDRMTSRVVVVR